MNPQEIYKYCPRCKSELELLKNKKLYCASCDFQSYISPYAVNSCILTNEQNQILLVIRKNSPRAGLWDLPGGFVEFDETVEESVVREVAEETNIRLSLNDIKFNGSDYLRYLYKGVNLYLLAFNFAAKIPSKESEILAGDDALSFQFFDEANLPWDKLAFMSTYRAISRYYASSHPLKIDKLKQILTISDSDFGISIETTGELKRRFAARAIITNPASQIALLYSRANNYYKLPGGGVKQNESNELALRREILEECGAEVDNIKALGSILEFRAKYNLEQLSNCYIADLVDFIAEPSFEQDEQSQDFKLVFLDLDEAINKIEILFETKINQVSEGIDLAEGKLYEALFMLKRDLVFLKEFKK